MKRIFFWLMTFLMGAIVFNAPAMAQEKFPAKAVTMLIGYEPGSATDASTRYLADYSAKIFKQPAIAVNRPGGGGSVALAELKNAPPDGHTLGILTAGGAINALLMKVPYHPVQDFEAIIHYMTVPEGLLVSATSPFKTVDDLLNYARANPGKVTYGSAGPNIALNMARLGGEAKVKWTNIPYGGGASIIPALMGGHLTCAPVTTQFVPYVKAGKLRLLATFTDKRMENFPEVPTLKELGYNISGSSIFGIVGPQGIPKDRVQLLHDVFHKGMETPQFQDILRKFEAAYDYLDSEAFKKRIEEFYNGRVELMKKYGEALK